MLFINSKIIIYSNNVTDTICILRIRCQSRLGESWVIPVHSMRVSIVYYGKPVTLLLRYFRIHLCFLGLNRHHVALLVIHLWWHHSPFLRIILQREKSCLFWFTVTMKIRVVQLKLNSKIFKWELFCVNHFEVSKVFRFKLSLWSDFIERIWVCIEKNEEMFFDL